MPLMATTTVRLPEPLKLESETYAASLGISLNALMAVALRDYLDSRRAMPRSGKPLPLVPAVAPSSSPVTSDPPLVRVPSSEAPKPVFKRPKEGASAPCPCGAKSEPYGYPVKWKHCHGKP